MAQYNIIIKVVDRAFKMLSVHVLLVPKYLTAECRDDFTFLSLYKHRM